MGAVTSHDRSLKGAIAAAAAAVAGFIFVRASCSRLFSRGYNIASANQPANPTAR